MSVLKLKLYTARPTAGLVAQFETAGGNHAIANRLINYVTSLTTGTELAYSATVPPSIYLYIQENEVQASGTFTFASIANTNTLAINGVTFTCVTSGATGNQFNVGASDTEAAANAVIAINASVTALVSGYVTASSALGVVTITSSFYGISGNMTTITGGTHVTASGTRLTAGANDATAQTISF